MLLMPSGPMDLWGLELWQGKSLRSFHDEGLQRTDSLNKQLYQGFAGL